MSLRHFLHIPKRTAKLIIYSVVCAIVLFLALTRTKVGRDGLRVQMEKQFNATFYGDIQIGRLQGNLLKTLYAEDITFVDREGEPVATIDAAILEPSWIELMRKTIAMNRITLVKPDIHIKPRNDSTWNVQDLFKRKDGRPPQLFFNSSDIRIIDGTVQQSNYARSSLPDADSTGLTSRLFTQIQAQLNIETRSEAQLFDVQYANFELPKESITVQDFHGQVFIGKGRIGLNDIYLESDETHLVLSASISNVDSLASAPWASTVDIELQDSVIDLDALQRLIPNLPFANTIFLSTSIHGTIDNLVVRSFQLAHDNLIVDAGGTARGLPDSLQFTFDLGNSSFSKRDLTHVIPGLDVPILSSQHTILFPTLYGKGFFPFRDSLQVQPFYSELTFGLSSPGGDLSGNIEISRSAADSLTYLNSLLNADSLDVASLIDYKNLSSSLNGEIFVEGSGETIQSLETDIRVQLSSSEIQGRRVDTLDTYFFTGKDKIELQGSARHSNAGYLSADATVYLDKEDRSFEAEIYVEDLDVQPIIRSDSFNTSLNGSVVVSVTGNAVEQLRGQVTVDLDSSSVSHGSDTRPVRANELTLALIDISTSTQRLSLDGDIGSLVVDGYLHPNTLFTLGQLWTETIARNVSEIIQKDRPSFLPSGNDPSDSESTYYQSVTAFYLDQLALDAQEHFLYHPLPGSHSLDINFNLREAEHLYPWLAQLPPFSSNLRGHFSINSNLESMDVAGSFQADSLISDNVGFENLRGRIDVGVDRTTSIENQLTFNTTFQTDSLHFINQVFPQVTVLSTLDNRFGSFEVQTKSTDKVGPQRMISTFELRQEKNIFNIQDLFLSVGNSFWTIGAPTSIDIYEQTLVIPGLTLESKSPEANILQRIELAGVLSPSPLDTTSIRIDDIAIRPISQFLKMEVPLGGLLNGKLAFTTTENQPELTGLLQVDRFSFDTRVLGNVSLSSRYIPGSPDVGLRIDVSPVAAYNQEEFLPDAALPATYEENELVIDGTFRLPRFNQAATSFIDAGEINLDVDMTRADVFFFEYIFTDLLERTDGYLTGEGTILGSFDYPVFDLDLHIREGELYIPKFNLRYTDFEGPLRIDEQGIKLQDATFSDPTGGRAEIAGGILFNNYRFFSFDLEARLNEILIMNRDNAQDLPFYGQIWGSGTLQLTGPSDNAFLFSQDAVTKASSELFIPVTEEEFAFDEGFIIFADSAGNIPDFSSLSYRKNLLSKRPEGERKFIDGMDMDLNISVPTGSTIHLVFDPLLGDVINAVSSGRVQLQKREGEFSTFGRLSVESGDYLFTAGDVFARRFLIERGGSITWDGNPINARLNIPASYKTRASTAGLPGNPFNENSLIPLIVRLDIDGRVSSPQVNLRLEADRSDRSYKGNYEGIEVFLNQSERTTDFATSVLLTNSFLLTTEASPNSGALTNSGEQLAFSSVSQLVSSQLNRFLNEAIPNADFNLGLQGESLEDPDVTYGVALYLLNERLVIRGQGIYQRDLAPNQAGLEGEFEVEVRLTPSVSVSVFLRQEGDVLENELTRARGAGISYQTQFSSWGRFIDRLFGWVGRKKEKTDTEEPVAQGPDEH